MEFGTPIKNEVAPESERSIANRTMEDDFVEVNQLEPSTASEYRRRIAELETARAQAEAQVNRYQNWANNVYVKSFH